MSHAISHQRHQKPSAIIVNKLIVPSPLTSYQHSDSYYQHGATIPPAANKDQPRYRRQLLCHQLIAMSLSEVTEHQLSPLQRQISVTVECYCISAQLSAIEAKQPLSCHHYSTSCHQHISIKAKKRNKADDQTFLEFFLTSHCADSKIGIEA
jgi:hypothetical protein